MKKKDDDACVCSPVRRYWCATAGSWPAGLPTPGGSAVADPSSADCAAGAACIPHWIHPRSRDRKPPCQPVRRTCQPRGNLCIYVYIYIYIYMYIICIRTVGVAWASVASKIHTGGTDAGKYVINSRAIRCAIHSRAVITRAKNADTDRTRNRNESYMRCRTRMCQRASPHWSLRRGIILCNNFSKFTT